MKILITGAGLVGCAVAKKMVEMQDSPVLFDIAPRLDYIASIVPLDKVTVVTGDVTSMIDLMRAIKKEKVEQVVHTAFMLTAASKDRPHTGISINIGGTVNVLEACRLAEIKKIVFCSSSTVYARASVHNLAYPYREDMEFKIVSQRPTTIYAATKLSCENLGLVYNYRYGLDFIALRLAGVFGPFRGPQGWGGFNTVLIREIIEAALSQKDVVLSRPAGWPYPRELVYTKDVANAIVEASHNNSLSTKVYNIGMGKFYDFPDVVAIANNIFPGSKIHLADDKSNPLPDDTGWYYDLCQPFDISLAEKELGFVPQYDLDQSMLDFSNWLRSS